VIPAVRPQAAARSLVIKFDGRDHLWRGWPTVTTTDAAFSAALAFAATFDEPRSHRLALGAAYVTLLRETGLVRVEIRERLLGVDRRRRHFGDEWEETHPDKSDEDLVPF
jgi:hypothetical protein